MNKPNKRKKTKSIRLKKESGSLMVSEEDSNDENHIEAVFKRREKSREEIISNKDLKSLPKKKRRTKKKFTLSKFVFLTIICAFVTFLVISAIPVINSFDSYNKIRALGNEILAQYANENISAIDRNVAGIQEELTKLENEIDNLSYLRYVPLLNQYYENALIGKELIVEMDNFINIHYADARQLLASEVSNSFVEKDISYYVSQIPEYLDLYISVESDLSNILEVASKINTEALPIISESNKQRIDSLKRISQNYELISNNAVDAIKNVPDLLGFEEETTYLVVLQNEAEMRASGGLLTAYGTVTFQNGELIGEISLEDTWTLENYVSSIGGLYKYPHIYGQLTLFFQGCGDTAIARAQDVNMYPDLYWSMQAFADYYDVANANNPTLFPDYDHIVILNFAFAEELLEIVQPLEVDGFGTVTADTLFEFIKNDTDDPTLSFSPERKRILGEIANALKDKFFSLEPSELVNVSAILIESFQKKNVALATDDPAMQRFFDRHQLSGRVDKTFQGDYFHLNEAQNCSLKLNKFVRNEVTQNILIDDSGTISKDINVYWENPQVYNESLKLQYDIKGDFTYRAWVRVFTPLGTEDFQTDGLIRSGFVYYIPEEYNDDVVQKSISDNVIQFDHRRLTVQDPIPTEELNISYELPFTQTVSKKNPYEMLIQKHPGKSWGEMYTVNITWNGKTSSTNFILEKDVVLSFDGETTTLREFNTSLDWAKTLINTINTQ